MELTPGNQTSRHTPYNYILYVGLYIFGIGAISLNLLHFWASIECSSTVELLLSKIDIKASDGNISFPELHLFILDNDVFAALNIFKSLSVILQVGIVGLHSLKEVL